MKYSMFKKIGKSEHFYVTHENFLKNEHYFSNFLAKNKHCFKHLMLFFTSTIGKSLGAAGIYLYKKKGSREREKKKKKNWSGPAVSNPQWERHLPARAGAGPNCRGTPTTER